MANKRIELATAYMPVMLSFRGVGKQAKNAATSMLSQTAARSAAQKFSRTFTDEFKKTQLALSPGQIGKLKQSYIAAIPDAKEAQKKMNKGGPIVLQVRIDNKKLTAQLKAAASAAGISSSGGSSGVGGPVRPVIHGPSRREFEEYQRKQAAIALRAAERLARQNAANIERIRRRNEAIENRQARERQRQEQELQRRREQNQARINSAINATFGRLGSGLIRAASGFIRYLTQGAFTFTANLARGMASAAAQFAKSIGSAAANAAGLITAAIGGIAASSAGEGLSQALKLNDAEARLKGIGQNAKEIRDSITGMRTPNTLADNMNAAAKLLGAGVEAGSDLTSKLDSASRAALQTGYDFSEIIFVYGQIAAGTNAQLQDIMQLEERNIPVRAYLSKELKKTRQEINEMISGREITPDTVFNVIAKNIADLDTILDNSLRANITQMKNKYIMLFSTMWEPMLKELIPVVAAITPILDELQKRLDTSFKSSKLRAVMKDIVDSMELFVNGIGVTDITTFFDKVDTAIFNFYNAVKKIKGPVIGLLAGIVATMASRLPLVGGLFAGISPLVGLFAGTFIQAYMASDKLQESVKGLWEELKNMASVLLGDLLGVSGNKDPLEFLGDRMATGLNKVRKIIRKGFKKLTGGKEGEGFLDTLKTIADSVWENVKGFIGRMQELWPEVEAAFGGIFDAIGTAFSTKGKDNFGQNLADTIVALFSSLSSVLQVVIPLAADLIRNIVDLVKSDAFQKLLDWLAAMATVAVNNKTIILSGIAILGAIFIGSRLIKVISAILSLFGVIGKPAKFSSSLKSLGLFFLAVAATIATVQLAGAGIDKLGGMDNYMIGLEAFKEFFFAVFDVIKKMLDQFTLGEAGFAGIALVAAKLFKSFGGGGAAAGGAGFMAGLKAVSKYIIAGLGILSGIIVVITSLGNLINLDPNGYNNYLTGLNSIVDFFFALTDIFKNIAMAAVDIASYSAASPAMVANNMLEAFNLKQLSGFTDILARQGVAAGKGAGALGGGLTLLAAGLTALAGAGIAENIEQGTANLGTKAAAGGAELFRLANKAVGNEAGADAAQGYIDSMTKTYEKAESPLQSLFSNLTPLIDTLGMYSDRVYNFGSDLAQAILDGFISAAPTMMQGIYNIMDQLMLGIRARFASSIVLASGNSGLGGLAGGATSITNNTFNYTANKNSSNDNLLEQGILQRTR